MVKTGGMILRSGRSKSKTLLLCIFLGYLGIHRFYVGKGKSGLLYMLTLGLFGIGWIIDIIMIATDSFTDVFGNRIQGGYDTDSDIIRINTATNPPPSTNSGRAIRIKRVPRNINISYNSNDYPRNAQVISQEDRLKLRTPSNGYTLKYHYTDVEVCWFSNVYHLPRSVKPGNRVIFKQEPTNPYDNKAVLLMFVPQKAPFGYLHRGKIQGMVNDYISKGDKVEARLSYLQFSPVKKMKIDIAFYKKVNHRKS